MIKVNKCGAALMFAAGVLSLVFGAWASPVTTDEAATAVGNWLSYRPQLGCRLGSSVALARTCTTTNGASFHVVKLDGGGFVVTSADTENEPIVAFSESDDLVESKENPLWVMLQRDFSAQVGTARQLHAATARSSSAGVSVAAQKWARILQKASTNGTVRLLHAATGVESVSDVRVAPLLKTKWSQEQDSYYSNLGDPCYNYYTPNNYPCGCVATATAQIMRYHKYPTTSVTPGTYECRVNDISRFLTMQGGTYDWDSMPLVPADGTTEAQRQAIGKLTSDIGIACLMAYYDGGSSAGAYMTARCLPERFGYASAVTACDTNLIQPSIVHRTLRSNLDAKLPVICGLSDGYYGHAVVADGYGYSMSTFYVHFNFGWAGKDDAWYAPPNVAEYNLFETLVFNIYPEGVEDGVICSGRVTDGNGSPLANVEVAAKGTSSATVMTDDNGIYAFILEPGTYKISSGNDSQTLTLSANVGTVVNDNGTYKVSPYEISNRCDVNLTVTGEAPEIVTHTVTFVLGEHGTRTGGGELTQAIENGTAATAPTVKANDGWEFTGWDKTFDNVTADLTVTAQYKEVAAPVGGAGVWTTDVDAVKSADDCKLVIVLCANYGGCGWSQRAQPIFESEKFLSWAAENGVYLVTSDSSRLPAGHTDAGDAGNWFWTLYWSVSHPDGYVYYPSIAIARPSDFSQAVGYAVVRDDGNQRVGGVTYDGTADSLIRGLSTYLDSEPEIVTHTVTFVLGEHGTRTGGGELTQTIEDGTAATAPTVEADDGWKFTGWDKAFDNVTADLTVTAQYEEKSTPVPTALTVTGENNAGDYTSTITMSGIYQLTSVGLPEWVESVDLDVGNSHQSLDSSVKYQLNLPFSGTGTITLKLKANTGSDRSAIWTIAGVDDTGDIIISISQKGGYVIPVVTHTVTFVLGEHGTRTGGGELTQTIKDGTAATAPTVEANDGWEFTGWDKTFDNVTADLTVTAQWQETPKDPDPSQTPDWTPVTQPDTIIGYFVVSNVETSTRIETDGSKLAAFAANGECRGVANVIDGPNGRLFSLSIGIASSTEKDLTLKCWDAATQTAFDVNDYAIDASVAGEQIGRIVAPVILTIGAVPVVTHTVTFVLGEHGTRTGGGELTQTIEEGAAATAPTVEANDGWEFTGWDKAFDNVTADLTVTAQWQETPNDPDPDPEYDPDPETESDSTEHSLVEDVEPTGASNFVATTYNGYLYDETDGSILGTIQVKAAKAKYNRKTELTTTRLTIAIQRMDETKKISISGDYDLDAGDEQTFTNTKSDRSVTLLLGENGLTGSFEDALIVGVPNVFLLKDTNSKEKASDANETYVGTYNIISDEGTFAISIAKKGKVKIAGTLEGGKKVSTSTQLLISEDIACIPIVLSKYDLAFVLWFDETIEVDGLTNANAGEAGELTDNATFCIDADELSSVIGDTTYADYFPDGLSVTQNRTKWVVADGAKAGSVVLKKDKSGIDETKLGDNPSALKLTYNAKSGTFTGSFKAYIDVNNKPKAMSATVSGVLVDGVGYGTATIKKYGTVKIEIR